MQAELRHLTESIKKDVRFRSEDMVERADLETPAKVQVRGTRASMSCALGVANERQQLLFGTFFLLSQWSTCTLPGFTDLLHRCVLFAAHAPMAFVGIVSMSTWPLFASS